jgi:phosphoribosyl-ATP pyrophosphohydrolase/phosphoribosyl-AMP cyclohydrolase
MIPLKFDDRGLVVAIAQDRLTGRIQMVAWMNAEAFEKTVETGRATFWSRSRAALWTKGETSGHVLDVFEIRVDCDRDAILLLVEPAGPSCHTGEPTCFFEAVDGGRLVRRPAEGPLLEALAAEIEARKASDAGKSYTKSLLDGGAEKIGGKLREEADELARAIAGESAERVASEAADVIYHLMVGLASRGVSHREVLAALGKRRGTSGHVEKANRPRG